MTNIQEMQTIIEEIYEQVETKLHRLSHLVLINQNPGCGGDRNMTGDEWTAIRDCRDRLDEFRFARNDLLDAIERRDFDTQLSKDEKEAQRRNFAYGNVKLSNDNITREMIDLAAEKLEREK